jgi:hypothetical protein
MECRTEGEISQEKKVDRLHFPYFCTILAKRGFLITASSPQPPHAMATRRKHLILTQPEREGKAVKVRLDSRTVVLVKNAKALASWKQRYPKAEIIKD